MKKAAVVIGVVLLLVLLIPVGLFALLHSSYSATSFNRLAQHQNWPIQVDTLTYQFPYHLTAQGIRTNQASLPYIEQLDVWFSAQPYQNNQWQIDSLLLDGVTAQQGLPDLMIKSDWAKSFNIKHIALSNWDFANPFIAARGLNLQINQPQWHEEQALPYGEIQLSSDQIYWQGEAIDQLLIDLVYKPKDSTLYGISFEWRDAKVTGQAEQFDHGWSLINVTIDGLKLSAEHTAMLHSKTLAIGHHAVSHINSLDLLNSQISWQDLTLENLDASIEDLNLPLSPWQQKQGWVSLQADQAIWQSQHLVSPRVELQFFPDQVIISDASTEWQQGMLSLSGRLSPNELHLDQVQVDNVKWTLKAMQDLPYLWPYLRRLDSAQVDTLSLRNVQFIQLAQEPYWQITGLDLNGKRLNLKQEGRVGLWHGTVSADANNASFRDLVTTQASFRATSKQGDWQIEQLMLPLKQGYIDAFGQGSLGHKSQPWALTLNTDGLPTDVLLRHYPLPVDLRGFIEMEARLTGLAGDDLMLAHSLSGQVNAQVHHGARFENDEVVETLSFSPLNLTLDRGRLSMSPMTWQGETTLGVLNIDVDLIEEHQGEFRYQLQQTQPDSSQCLHYDMDLRQHILTTSNQCVLEAQVY